MPWYLGILIWLAACILFCAGYMCCAIVTAGKIADLRDLASGRRDKWLEAIKAREIER
jgi:hypothetical protein